MSDIHKIKQILRFHNLHEQGCALYGEDADSGDVAECDCWLSEDPWDAEASPPAHVDIMKNGAATFRTHTYDDGRLRTWSKRHGDHPWVENWRKEPGGEWVEVDPPKKPTL